jgi:hypothetical protein
MLVALSTARKQARSPPVVVLMGLLRRLSSTPSRRKSSEPDSPPTKTDAPDSKVPEGGAQEADITPTIPDDDGATATMTLYLQKKNGRLGISIDDDNFVHDVDEGSAGQDAGFCIGDWVSCQHTSLSCSFLGMM